MKQKIARETGRENAKLRVESLPFSEIPHQSRLFLEYLSDPVSLKKYYPNAVASYRDVSAFAGQVLASYSTDREQLCDALAEINREAGASDKTFTNIELLRRPDTVAVVTGQQAGLFTGPLYTIYKALSAIKMVEHLNALGTPAVPVFWVASEDHDFDEVSRTFFVGSEGELVETDYRPADYFENVPVGQVEIDASITDAIDDLFARLSQTDASSGVRAYIEKAWAAGASFSTAFARNLTALLSDFGLIFVDPLDDRLKKLSSPVYVEVVEKAGEIVSGIRQRSAELEREGYHAQVLVEKDYFPLFWHTDDGRRVAIRKLGDDRYGSKDDGGEFTLSQLSDIARDEPQRFSPGVMLRPVVQDYLLPTICYVGGAAEIAYFAQNSEAYRILGRPVTPIVHRQSVTVLESKQARALEKFGLKFTDLFSGVDAILEAVVEKSVSPQTAQLFAEVEEKINSELNRLDQALSDLDPTLAANLATRRRKIIYHIAALKKKAYRAQLRRAENVDRQIRSAFNALLPNGQLQERVLNVHSFLNKYGPNFIDWLYDAVDLDDRGHRVITFK